MFVQTTASEKVENLIKSKNLVIVAGHSGCGKTAIVQHIALKYRKSGWVVKPVDKVGEIKKAYTNGRYKRNKTIFVLNDPIGKESLSEILHTKWKKYEETLKTFLQYVKLVITCRTCIIFDTRVKGLLQERSNIVVVDDKENKLKYCEKKAMLKKYTTSEDISEEDILKILENEKEMYFPLLCKLFASDRKHLKNALQFFMEPINVLKEEIQIYKEDDKEKYCGLVCLVLFDNNLREDNLIESKELFQKCLNLCDVWVLLPPKKMIRNLELLEGFFVKNVCKNYQFYHDFVMEVTSSVFGNDYPKEILKHADIGFLQRRVRLENCTESVDPLTITLRDPYIIDLVDRLSEDIFSDRFIEVVLNPCLRNEKVTALMIKRMEENPHSLQMIVKQKTLKNIEQEIDFILEDNWFSRLDFMNLFKEISPLFALIVFRHNELSRFFLEALDIEKEDVLKRFLFPAMCCNGSTGFYGMISKKQECLSENESILHPIHIVSIFNNYKLLSEMVKGDIDVNMTTKSKHAWTPLTLAAASKKEKSSEQLKLSSRDETINILLTKGANINLCTKHGISPLFLACKNGHDSTVEMFINKGAEVNLCTEKGTSPLFISCQNGNDKIVQILLKNGANVGLCNKTGASPLFIACENGHDSTVQTLLNNAAEVIMKECKETGCNPLSIAFQNGHDKIVQLLRSNGADVNFCKFAFLRACEHGDNCTVQRFLNNGADPNLYNKSTERPLYVASKNGYNDTVQLLIDKGADVNFLNWRCESPLYKACENGHDRTIQLLLENGADVNLCDFIGKSPLYIACERKHESTVQLLLNDGADVNLINGYGKSLLHTAIANGHDTTVQYLLNKGADVNLCTNHGTTSLYIASEKGHDSIVQLLLNNGANVNFFNVIRKSPLYIASKNKHDSTVQLLLTNGANVNVTDDFGKSLLHVASENGHDDTVQFLLNNGAKVNRCNNIGETPLQFACEKGHGTTVQLLLNNGADVNLSNVFGKSLLHLASENGHNTIVQLLINKGCDVNLRSKNAIDEIPLHLACENGHDSTIELLLNNGADVNLCNNIGETPLHFACEKGYDTTVQLLLNNGACVNSYTNSGKSPLHFARKNGHDCIVETLLKYGAENE